jgi:biopolymer transport protein ExbD
MASIETGDDKDRFTLNLYPMVDIFSILICFLLMNFSTQGESVDTRNDLELPRSDVRISLDTAATVSISKREIVVQGSISIPIQPDGDVAEGERMQGGLARAYDALKKVKESNETLKNRGQASGISDTDLNTLTLEADKTTKFNLVKRVMLTAQQAEFISWKLAVEKSEID